MTMTRELAIHHGDLSGLITVNAANGQTLDDFCAAHIPEYNRDRLEAMAMRVFVGKETVITVYAADKYRQDGTAYDQEKIPVKKFKITTLTIQDLFSYCESFNFTLSTGSYEIDDMEVMNK
jgi:hypothetical protein